MNRPGTERPNAMFKKGKLIVILVALINSTAANSNECWRSLVQLAFSGHWYEGHPYHSKNAEVVFEDAAKAFVEGKSYQPERPEENAMYFNLADRTEAFQPLLAKRVNELSGGKVVMERIPAEELGKYPGHMGANSYFYRIQDGKSDVVVMHQAGFKILRQGTPEWPPRWPIPKPR